MNVVVEAFTLKYFNFPYKLSVRDKIMAIEGLTPSTNTQNLTRYLT
jgi:hypothetical protein